MSSPSSIEANVRPVVSGDGLLGLARRLLGGAAGRLHSPEDLVHDVVAQALSRTHGDSLSSPPTRWLRRALRSRAAELGRREVRRSAVELPPTLTAGLSSPSAIVGGAERAAALRSAVRSLDPRSRRVVVRRVVSDLPFAKIAAAEGIREDHARAIFSRAAARLRSMLGANWY